MAYRALYRQYRPTQFSEVIGQAHITTTLIHQIESGHVAHAYLFCGTRGTGKTTTARILARAVNCLTPNHGEPCGECDACKAALSDTNGDIIEIDAASNNGVDDVRSLIERVQYAPIQLKYRVYIIDEAHMITGAAFNALLKTLEEPPAHVVFILATTEPQKLPATILSRCQRYDFHRLSVQDIVSTLQSVLTRAGASIEEEGLLLIARSADGGMRDALSLADQCLSFCGNAVTTQDVYDVLGSMEEGFLFDMADALLSSDAPRALSMLSDIVRGGRDLTVFTSDIASHFRALLLSKTCGECADLLDCSHDAMQRYLAQAKDASQARLLLALELLLKAQGDMRYLSSPRTMLESTLVRVCRPEQALTLTNLEARVDQLENALRQGVVSPAAPAKSLPCEKEEDRAAAKGSTSAQPSPPEAPPWDDAPLPEPPPETQDAPAPRMPAAAIPRMQTAPVRAETPAPVHSEAAAPKAALSDAEDMDAAALWNAVLAAIQTQNIMVYAMAQYGVAQSIRDNALVVGFSEGDTVRYNSVSAAINFNRLQTILQELRPGMQLQFVKTHIEPASEAATDKAKALFGEQLIIED